jgi:two-component system cell cycle response regulator DivK
MDKNYALVIEDDYDASNIFATALRVAGFNAEIINSGDVAQKRLGEVVPDLVLLDLHLPHVVGTDLLQQIRDDLRLKDTRVIVATADARLGDMTRTEADLVLIKPATFSQVRDLAVRLMRKASTSAAAK